MKLTDTQIRQAKPAQKRTKLADGRGLYLEITPTGSKLWRYKYRYNGKEKLYSIGKYPDVSLKRARELHQEARTQVAEGIDPSKVKRQAKLAKKDTFGALAEEWFETNRNKWTPGHAGTVWRRLEVNVLPWLKDRPIREITAREILEVLRRIETRGAVETAHRVHQIIRQVFVFCVAAGYSENNPASDLNKALKPVYKRSFPAITEPKRLRELLLAIDGLDASFVVFCALRFLPLVFVRPGELRHAEWSEIDWGNALWVIPAYRMKKKRDHLVPLSRQALDILRTLYPLTGDGRFIFPTVRTKARPMSENTLSAALLRLGFSKEEHVPHGFRTTASTMLHEQGWPSGVIELQLSHVDVNTVRGVYNRAEHLEERRRMMQAWADYLDGLKAGNNILPAFG